MENDNSYINHSECLQLFQEFPTQFPTYLGYHEKVVLTFNIENDLQQKIFSSEDLIKKWHSGEFCVFTLTFSPVF